jgi:hypothetical protein
MADPRHSAARLGFSSRGAACESPCRAIHPEIPRCGIEGLRPSLSRRSHCRCRKSTTGRHALPHHLDACIGFSGRPSFALLFHAKGGGLEEASRQPSRRTPTSRLGSTTQTVRLRHPSVPCRKTIQKPCTKPVHRNRYWFSPDFVQLVLVLDHFCPIAQLFPPRLRATFERKLKYETAHTIVYPDSRPVEGSKGSR